MSEDIIYALFFLAICILVSVSYHLGWLAERWWYRRSVK